MSLELIESLLDQMLAESPENGAQPDKDAAPDVPGFSPSSLDGVVDLLLSRSCGRTPARPCAS
jgi:hypothetical protein